MQRCNFSGRPMLLSAISTGLLLSSLSFHAQADNVEHVEVIGQPYAAGTRLSLDSTQVVEADLRDTLKRLPGMSANGNGPLTAITQYRGLFGDRVRLNLDGAPVIGAGPNAMDPPLSNVFALPGTQINLYRGIAPVSLGTQTLGGALQISRDKQGLFEQAAAWHGQLHIQHNDQGSADNALATLGFHHNNFYLQAFGAMQKRDDVDDGNGQAVPNSFYDRSMLGVAAGAKFNNHQFHGYYHKVDTDETGTPALAMDIQYIDSSVYRLSYDWQVNEKASLTLKAHGNSNQHGMNNVDYRPVTMPMMARLNTVDSLARGYSAVWKSETASGKLETGLDWHTAKHNSVITNPEMNNLTIQNFNNIEMTTGSAYAQWGGEWQVMEVLLGARYTQVDSEAGVVANSMAMMNPNVATLVEGFNAADRELDFNFVDVTAHISDQLTDNMLWHVALGQKNRAPSYTELYVWLPLGISAGLADGWNYLGNLNLKEETAHQLDLGVTYQDDTITVSPRLFYQKIDDYIVGVPSTNMTANMISTMMSGRAPLQWQNVDATLYGADLQLNARLKYGLSLEMIASIVRGNRDDIDEPLYRIAPMSLVTRLGWQSKRWSVLVESELVASQSRVSLVQQEAESAGYGVLNASFSYRLNQEVSFTAGVTNLLDKAYQPHLSGVNRVMGVTQPAGQKLYARGRSVNASMKLVF